MANLTETLVKQKRFQAILVGLLVLAIVLGLVIVPVERGAEGVRINSYFNGVWWAVTTITSVGYGDMVPVTGFGKVLGMILQVSGVLAFGLLVSLVTVSLDEAKERYYRNRLDERLERIEGKLEKLEKGQNYVVRREIEKD